MKSILLAFALLLPAFAWASTRRDDFAPALPVEPTTDDYPAQLDAPSFLEVIGLLSMSNTRGERNNNPGNIRLSASSWRGKVQGSDPSFETFADPVLGIRALAKLLRNYQVNAGLRTVRQIVARYAPASENNTEAYIRAVAASMGVSPDADLNLQDDGTLARLVAAVIHHENGRNIYAAADIAKAVELA